MSLQETAAATAPRKGKALPPVVPPGSDTIDVTLASVRQIPHKLIDASSLNPRKEPDAEKITELASSILAQGVLQNLVLRPHPKKEGRFEIAAGESRWRAVGNLIHDGDLPGDFTVPALVRDLTDRQLLELALTENVQRRDLTAMEEARAFQRLVEMEVGTDEIADRVGCSRRHVQLRLALLKLDGKVQEALADGEISTEMGRKIALAPTKRQAEILKEIRAAKRYGDDMTADHVAEMARERMISTKAARFDLNLYKGEFTTIEEEPKEKFFADIGQYEALQRAWIKGERAALSESWKHIWEDRTSEAELDGNTSLPHDWTKAAADDKTRGVLILIGSDMSVAIFKGVKKFRHDQTRISMSATTAARLDNGEGAAPTLQFLALCRNLKTKAIQRAVAGDPDIAKRAICLALMGGTGCVRLRISEPRRDDRVIDGTVCDQAAALRGRFTELPLEPPVKEAAGWEIPIHLKRPQYGDIKEGVQAAAVEALAKIGGKELDKLLAVLTAPLVGTFNEHYPALGDEPHALAFAKMAKAELPPMVLSDEFLQAARKGELAAMVADLKIEHRLPTGKNALDLTGPQLREILKTETSFSAPQLKGYVPPWLMFASNDEINAELRKLAPKKEPKPKAAPAKKAPKKTTAKKPATKKPAKAKGKKK